jgi:hypothetical protein
MPPFLRARFTWNTPHVPTQAGSLCYFSPSCGCLGFVELAVLTPTRPHTDTVPLPSRSADTSGRSDSPELKRCLRLLKFPVLLFLLVILNQHRRLPRLHRSSRLRLPQCRHRLVPFLRSNRCQHRLRSRVICLALSRLGDSFIHLPPALSLSGVFLPRKTIISEPVHDPPETFFSRFFGGFRSFYRARSWR